MSYYLGREFGIDGNGSPVEEYVIYTQENVRAFPTHICTPQLVKVVGFTTLDEAVKCLRDCYAGLYKISPKLTKTLIQEG